MQSCSALDMTHNKQELIEQYHQWRAGREALVQQVSEQRMDQPETDGSWSFKDLAAHMGYWWGFEASRLEAALSGEPPAWNRNVEQQNQEVYERNKNRAPREVLADADAACERIEAALDMLSEQALFEVGRYPWAGGVSLGQEVVAARSEHMYDEHGVDIEYWRSQT
jgi:hypothetical protein